MYCKSRLLRVSSSRTAPRCPRRWSTAPPRSAIRRSRCSIATASTARRDFISRRSSAGIKAIIGAELTIARAAGRRRKTPASAAGIVGSRAAFVLGCRSSSSRGGYRNLCRLVTRMKLRAPKGEGALALEELDGALGGLVALAGRAALDGRALRRRRAARSPRRHLRRARTSTSSCSGTCCATRKPTTQALRRSRVGVSRAGHRHQRRAVRRAGRSPAVRRAHLHPSQDDARARRAAADAGTPSAT